MNGLTQLMLYLLLRRRCISYKDSSVYFIFITNQAALGKNFLKVLLFLSLQILVLITFSHFK